MDIFSYFQFGNFLIIDLIAASTNALNGALLARSPSHYRGNYWTVPGILLLAIFGGIGGAFSATSCLPASPPHW